MRSLHLVGDSISIHYHPHLERHLAGRLAYSRKTGDHGNLDKPQGANGGDSAMVLAYLRGCREAGWAWDALAVNCGLHDIKTAPGTQDRQVPDEAYRANLTAIVDAGRAVAPRLLWIRTTPAVAAVHNARSTGFHRFEADQQRYNAIADAVMTAAGVPLIDLDGFTRSLGGDEIFCDHVHFTEPVRALQAAFMAGSLQALVG